jgi:hypothetical protein
VFDEEADVKDVTADELVAFIGSSIVISSIRPQYSSSLQESSMMATGLATGFGVEMGPLRTTTLSSRGGKPMDGVVCFSMSGFSGWGRCIKKFEPRVQVFKASRRVSIALRL